MLRKDSTDIIFTDSQAGLKSNYQGGQMTADVKRSRLSGEEFSIITFLS